MAKLSVIEAQLEAAAGRKQPKHATQEVAAHASSPASTKPKSREGLTHCGAWLPETFSRNILLVRAKTGLSVKTIYANALNDLFRAHGVPVVEEE